MAWVAVGMAVVGVAGSVAGGVAQNKQASAQHSKQVEAIKASLTKQYGQLQEQARQENDNAAMEMATARFEGLKATATTGSVLTERNIAGNTAARAFNQSLMNRTMAHNALAKKAEDAMVSFGSAMEAKRDEAIQAVYGAGAQLSANTKSTLAIATDATKAGASGYMMGSSLGGVFGASTNGAASSLGKVGAVETMGSMTSASGYGASMTTLSSNYSDAYFGGIK